MDLHSFVSDNKAFNFDNLFDNKKIPSKEKVSLITAYCQSGKTFIMIPVLLIYLSLGFTPVIVVKDVAQMIQFKERLNADVKKMKTDFNRIEFTYDSNLWNNNYNIKYYFIIHFYI